MKKLIWLVFLLPLTAFANPFTEEFCLEKPEDDICIGLNLDRTRLDALPIQSDALQARIDALEAGGGGGPFDVDCSAGETVQAAVDLAKQGDAIHVSGICYENVLITKNGITLDGGGTAEIVGIDSPLFAATISVRGATNVTIQSFALITGSSFGVFVRDNGQAIIGGEAEGTGNVISGNTSIGVAVAESSSAVIDSNTISNNGVPPSGPPIGGSAGVNVFANASAVIIGNDITNNGQSGVTVFSNSQAGLGGNLISGNQVGLLLANSAAIRITRFVTRPSLGPNQIVDNLAFGLFCHNGSSIFIGDSQLGVPDVLLTASGNGILDLAHTPSCAVFTNNTGLMFSEVDEIPRS